MVFEKKMYIYLYIPIGRKFRSTIMLASKKPRAPVFIFSFRIFTVTLFLFQSFGFVMITKEPAKMEEPAYLLQKRKVTLNAFAQMGTAERTVRNPKR